MNTKDIALLRYKDIKEGRIEFIRAKTRNTTKTNLKPIIIYLNEFTSGIIERYGNNYTGPDAMVFDIIRENMTAQEQHNRIKQISTIWARHSYASSSIRKGASMEFMQEALGHGNVRTTQNYFAGFDDESKREFASTLMDFE